MPCVLHPRRRGPGSSCRHPLFGSLPASASPSPVSAASASFSAAPTLSFLQCKAAAGPCQQAALHTPRGGSSRLVGKRPDPAAWVTRPCARRAASLAFSRSPFPSSHRAGLSVLLVKLFLPPSVWDPVVLLPRKPCLVFRSVSSTALGAWHGVGAW